MVEPVGRSRSVIVASGVSSHPNGVDAAVSASPQYPDGAIFVLFWKTARDVVTGAGSGGQFRPEQGSATVLPIAARQTTAGVARGPSPRVRSRSRRGRCAAIIPRYDVVNPRPYPCTRA
nr:hypothetical protein BDOA9_0151020 [Bradyrhizobium sp. DOA9]